MTPQVAAPGVLAVATDVARRLLPPPLRLPPALAADVERFDGVIDRWFAEALRGRRGADRLFYWASGVGDHGLLWMALAGAQAARRVRHRDQVAPLRPLVRALGGLGVESAVVNGPVKWVFRRERPPGPVAHPHRLRTPRTSSFPSGHACAAFYGASLLSEGDRGWAPLYYALAVVVAASRVHVTIHHASDVAGGALLGVALAEATRRLVPLEQQQRPGMARVGPPSESPAA